LPRAKAESLTKEERKSTAQKKKRAGVKGKTVVANTPKARVRARKGGPITIRGQGIVMANRLR
jgi:hypothetical protein